MIESGGIVVLIKSHLNLVLRSAVNAIRPATINWSRVLNGHHTSRIEPVESVVK